MTHEARSIRASLFLASALLLGAPAARGDDATLLSLPQSAAWRLGHAFVAAYNAGDADALRGYLSAHLAPAAQRETPVAARVAELLRLRAESGPLEVVEVSGVPHALVLNGGTADVVVIADGADPARLAALHVTPVAAEDVALRGAQ
jgi:hypothetical protein